MTINAVRLTLHQKLAASIAESRRKGIDKAVVVTLGGSIEARAKAVVSLVQRCLMSIFTGYEFDGVTQLPKWLQDMARICKEHLANIEARSPFKYEIYTQVFNKPQTYTHKDRITAMTMVQERIVQLLLNNAAVVNAPCAHKGHDFQLLASEMMRFLMLCGDGSDAYRTALIKDSQNKQSGGKRQRRKNKLERKRRLRCASIE